MNEYLVLIFWSLIGGVVSLIGGIVLLGSKKSSKVAYFATPFAAGALLSAVFLDLLVEGLHESSAETVLKSVLVGILLFFFAERFLHWFHHHHPHKDKKTDPSVPLIIAGDTIHNALDGVAIAAGFLISPATGIVTTLAIAAHEIPQEIGDFGLLLDKGLKKKKVLIFNVLSALATTVTAVVVYALGSGAELPLGMLLGLSGGFLLYIALSDIIPIIHQRSAEKHPLSVQPLLLLLGVVIVATVSQFAHQYIHDEHDESHNTSSQVKPHHDDEHHD
jgi:zinc and cadmium transporter